MLNARKYVLAGAVVVGTAAFGIGPVSAFGVGGHGGGGGFGGGHAGGFGGGHEGGFGGGRSGDLGGGRDARAFGGGDRVFTGRSVGIDRGGYARRVYRNGRWFDDDCSPLGIEEGLCPAGDDD